MAKLDYDATKLINFAPYEPNAYTEDDVQPLRFGKHKGMRPVQLLIRDAGYILWLHRSIDKEKLNLSAKLVEEAKLKLEPPSHYNCRSSIIDKLEDRASAYHAHSDGHGGWSV